MKVAVATISFGDEKDRRTIYWYGDEGEIGQLYLENEDLGIGCSLDQSKFKLQEAYPGRFWDLDLIQPLLCD